MRNYKMQKRHYQLIADLVRTIPADSFGGVQSLKVVAEHFAKGLSKTNPQFSRERFLEACETPNYPFRETRDPDIGGNNAD